MKVKFRLLGQPYILCSSEDRHLCRVGWRLKFFDYVSIEKVTLPFHGVNGKTDRINLPVFLVGWLLPDVHTVNDLWRQPTLRLLGQPASRSEGVAIPVPPVRFAPGPPPPEGVTTIIGCHQPFGTASFWFHNAFASSVWKMSKTGFCFTFR